MATFDAPDVTRLCRVFGSNSDVMAYHLNLYAAVITSDDKTAVLTDLTLIETIENDNVNVESRERNFGASITASAKRSLIKNRIAGLIQWPISSGASLVRG